MHPLACRGAVGYNQQANGRFALLWLVHLCAGRPAGTAAHPTGGCPLSYGESTRVLSGHQAQGQKRQREDSGRKEQLRQIRHGNPPLPCMDSEGAAHVRG